MTILGKLTAGFFGTTTNSLVLRTTPSDPISDIKFAAPITMLDLDEVQISSQGHHKLKMGTPIRKDDIIFKTTIKSKFTIITCNEVDNLDEDGDVLAILSIDDIKKYQFKNPPSRDFHGNYDKLLHFKIRDEIGDELPIIEMLIRVTINDVRLRRENLSTNSCNSAA